MSILRAEAVFPSLALRLEEREGKERRGVVEDSSHGVFVRPRLMVPGSDSLLEWAIYPPDLLRLLSHSGRISSGFALPFYFVLHARAADRKHNA